MIQDVLGVPVSVQEPFDCGFLRRYGAIFRVFDQQDSGNLCFGMQGRYGKLFVKYAGARTVNGGVSPGQAVANLKSAVPLYEQLRHPALARLLGHGAAGGGYAAVFAWVAGENLHPYHLFKGVEKYRNPDSPAVKLRRQPLLVRLRMLDRVFDFHAHADQKGFVAVDFYDGSLMADFATGAVTVCDIDLYRAMPAVNDKGRMPGSSRFMPPEEYEFGAALDSRTSVYAMGALAFEFLGSNADRRMASWTAASALYDIAARAASQDRSLRYPTVSAFLAAWREAVGRGTAY